MCQWEPRDCNEEWKDEDEDSGDWWNELDGDDWFEEADDWWNEIDGDSYVDELTQGETSWSVGPIEITYDASAVKMTAAAVAALLVAATV